MQPLNITITDLTLDTVVGAGYEEPHTLADVIVNAAVEKLLKDGDTREISSALAKRIAVIRDEEIRAKVRAELDDAMAKPIRKTNQWGEPTGQGETTLRELILAEAAKFFTEKRSKDSYGSGPKFTDAERVIAELVQGELKKDMAAAFAEEKAKVVAVVQGKAAELLADAVKAGLR